jgi:tetratricopeptide (TPR) repeat protein
LEKQVTEYFARFKFSLTLFLFLSLFGKAFSQRYPDPVVDSLINSGIGKIINQDYTGAKSTFENLESGFPELPAGKIFIAATDIARTFDYSDSSITDSTINILDEAQKQAENLIEKNPGSIWYRYFLALAEGYMAYYNGLNGSWFAALNKGLSSVSDFNGCLKIKPEFCEAFMAIGTYKYWRSRKTEFLNWLPFVKNEEDAGIANLKFSIECSSYHRYLAVNSLIWIYIDRKQYNDAKSLAEKALVEYPDTRLFLWGLARAYEGIDINKSIGLYFKILISYNNIKGLNRCKEIILKHIIAQLYDKIGDKKNALAECNEILAINNLSEFEKDKMNGRLARVKKLKKELLTELSK